jgi:hypothetical protein
MAHGTRPGKMPIMPVLTLKYVKLSCPPGSHIWRDTNQKQPKSDVIDAASTNLLFPGRRNRISFPFPGKGDFSELLPAINKSRRETSLGGGKWLLGK